MTIGWIEHQDAYCTWMDQAGEQKTGMFNLTVLEKMEDYA